MDHSENYYQVGSYSVEITAPLSIPYLAGNPRHQFFTGVHDPLYASAVVFSDGKTEAAVVTVDGTGICNRILGKDKNFSDVLKEKIEKCTGIKKEALIILSGHIHSTPDTTNFRPFVQYKSALPWLETLMEQICSAVKIAKNNKYKARLKVGKGRAEGISMNRRGSDCLDTEAIVLLFESVDDDQNIILVNYACHPVIVQVQELVSADYVGAMRQVVKNGLKDIRDVLFVQGACGDINPRRGWTRSFKDVYLTGAALAGEVIKTCSLMAAPDYPDEPVRIDALSEIVYLPSRSLPAEDEARKLADEVNELLPQYNNARTLDEKNRIHERLGPKEEAFYRIKEGDAPFKAEIQSVRLGNAVLVGIPGEIMCAMGLEIKAMFEPLTAIPAGYANGYLGYIASPEDWEKGGYEVELGPWSKVGCEAYSMILNTLDSLKRNMNNH